MYDMIQGNLGVWFNENVIILFVTVEMFRCNLFFCCTYVNQFLMDFIKEYKQDKPISNQSRFLIV